MTEICQASELRAVFRGCFPDPESIVSFYFLFVCGHLQQPVDWVVGSPMGMDRVEHGLKIGRRQHTKVCVCLFTFYFVVCSGGRKVCVAKPH